MVDRSTMKVLGVVLYVVSTGTVGIPARTRIKSLHEWYGTSRILLARSFLVQFIVLSIPHEDIQVYRTVRTILGSS
eukprot:COSAG02_NODE_31352_length_535_cov_0.733945_1_plen_76_part_00